MSEAEDLRRKIAIYRECLVWGTWKATASALLRRDIAAAKKALECIEKDAQPEKFSRASA
jgi:hypothetical protein